MWKYIILMRKTKGALFLLYGLVCICIWKSYKLFLIITTFTLPVCLLVATYENIFGSCGSTCLHPLCKLRVQVIHLNYVFEGYRDICSPFLPKSIRKFRDDVMHCFAFSGRECRSKTWACKKKNTVHLNCLNPVSMKLMLWSVQHLSYQHCFADCISWLVMIGHVVRKTSKIRKKKYSDILKLFELI